MEVEDRPVPEAVPEPVDGDPAEEVCKEDDEEEAAAVDAEVETVLVENGVGFTVCDVAVTLLLTPRADRYF